mmetsp:Transcript_10366/g.14283  ORF Transcript_10366/g.14283 Transcript_10366/m.14283 type:complete len:82 (+) Transcript_10366:281-526(+)
MVDKFHNWDAKQVDDFKKYLKQDFRYKLFLDDLPAAMRTPHEAEVYLTEIPLGFTLNTRSIDAVIFNHLNIEVTLHEVAQD